jgi:hypothetical protein
MTSTDKLVELVIASASSSQSFGGMINTIAPQLLTPQPQHQGYLKPIFPFHIKNAIGDGVKAENYFAKAFPTALCNAFVTQLASTTPTPPTPQTSSLFRDIAHPNVVHDATLEELNVCERNHIEQIPPQIAHSLLTFHLLLTHTAIQETLSQSTNPYAVSGTTKTKKFDQNSAGEWLDMGENPLDWLNEKTLNLVSDLKQTLFACGLAPSTGDIADEWDGNGLGRGGMGDGEQRDGQQHIVPRELLINHIILPYVDAYREQMSRYIIAQQEWKVLNGGVGGMGQSQQQQQKTVGGAHGQQQQSPLPKVPFFKPTFTFIELSRWLEIFLDCSTLGNCLYIIPYLETLAGTPNEGVKVDNFFPKLDQIYTSLTQSPQYRLLQSQYQAQNQDDGIGNGLDEGYVGAKASTCNILIKMATASKIAFPRMLNLFSKRLSNLQYPRLKGRINLLGSFLFNPDELFLVNLLGANNTSISYDHQLEIGNNDNDNDDGVGNQNGQNGQHLVGTAPNSDAVISQQASNVVKIIAMYLSQRYDGKATATTTSTATTTPTTSKTSPALPPQIPLPTITSMSDFFTLFWTIQRVFSDPGRLGQAGELNRFLFIFDIILTFFENQNVSSNTFNFHIKPSHLTDNNIMTGSTFGDDMEMRDGDNGDEMDTNTTTTTRTESVEIPFFPRYLPSKSLFPLQLYDSNVRKSLLIQFVFFTNLLFIIPSESSQPQNQKKAIYDVARELAKQHHIVTHLTQRSYHQLSQLEAWNNISPITSPLPLFTKQSSKLPASGQASGSGSSGSGNQAQTGTGGGDGGQWC